MGNLEKEKDDLVLSVVGDILRTAGGNRAVAMRALLDHTQREAVAKVERTTVAQRKAEYSRMLEAYQAGEGDPDELVKFETVARGIVDEILGNVLPDTPRALTAEEAKGLMQEYLHVRQLRETLDAREKARKTTIIADIDERLMAEGVLDPEAHNGVLEVPELGYKFCKEGAGYSDPTLDEDKLRVLLGEEMWQKISTARLVPEHYEYDLDVEKLLDLAREDPGVMLVLEDSLKPGALKRPRLNVREM